MNKYFIDVIKNHYIDFAGRATRTQFWLWVLWNIIFTVIFAIAGMFIPYIVTIFTLAVLLPNIAITVRRIKDAGFNIYWALLMVPALTVSVMEFMGKEVGSALSALYIICGIILLIICLLPSKK